LSHVLSAFSFTFQRAKEIHSPKRRQRLLTVIRENAILDLATEYEEGFHGLPIGGLFLLRIDPFRRPRSTPRQLSIDA
jgi:hypothetical protein